MLKFLLKFFRKPDPASEAFSALSANVPDSFVPVAAVKTAQLSLAAILEKMPDELKGAIQQRPDPQVKVALPVPTILKQLPGGAVRMSFASIYRQAPTGVFKPGSAEDKRMLTVPLSEVFRCISPEVLRRRDDQRPHLIPDAYIDLFGDRENPFSIAPVLVEAPPRVVVEDELVIEEALLPAAAAETVEPARMMAAPAELSASVAPAIKFTLDEPPAAPAMNAPAADETARLILSLSQLAENWPEPIKSEATALNGTRVALPADEVSAGLTRGKVAFTWAQLRQWTLPPTRGVTAGSQDTELVLPLRVVAPAFLKHSRTGEKKVAAAIGADIPELFNGGENARKFTAAAPAPDLVVEEFAPIPAPAFAEPEMLRILAPPPEEEPQRDETLKFAPANAPAVVEEAPATAIGRTARTLGEVFSLPDQAEWTPGEIVQHLSKLPQIDGAIIALQEGFVVAHQLPEPMRGEVFAAFLPQIFARLNQYTREMQLEPVDDLLTNTAGRLCQMFRLGEVFFAVLGKPGATLPLPELRLCALELSR